VLVKTAGVVSAASAPPPRTWGWPARWTIILFATVLFAGGVLAWNARRIENQVTVALACLARGEATCARQAIAPVANAVDGEPILQVAAAGVAVAGHRLDEAQGLLGAASSHGFGADRRLQAEWNLTMGDLLAARGQYHVALARYAEAGTRPGAGDHAQARSARLQARARTELGPLLLQARDGLAAVAAGAPLGRPQLAQDIMERLLGDDAGIASRVRAATAGLSPDLATRIAVARTLQARLADYPSQAPRPPAPLGAAQAKDPLAVADRDFAQKAYDRALEQYRDGQVDLERQLARANAESAEAAATVKAALAAVEQVLDELQVVRAPLPQSSELTAAPLGPQSEAPPPRMVPSGAAL
jgi:hypothetical protein